MGEKEKKYVMLNGDGQYQIITNKDIINKYERDDKIHKIRCIYDIGGHKIINKPEVSGTSIMMKIREKIGENTLTKFEKMRLYMMYGIIGIACLAMYFTYYAGQTVRENSDVISNIEIEQAKINKNYADIRDIVIKIGEKANVDITGYKTQDQLDAEKKQALLQLQSQNE